MNFDLLFKLYILLIVIMSFITAIIYAVDKRKAIKNKWRIPEKVLLSCTFLFGSVGALISSRLCHHKTEKWYFNVTIFGSLILHIALFVYLFINL